MVFISNKEKVLRVFFDNPIGKFHIREIARLTKLNPNTALNIIKFLEKENLIIKKKRKHLVEVSANVNDLFKELKRIDNLRKIYKSKIIDFLVKEFSPEFISIIGSYSNGEDIEGSDLDIVIISKKNKDINISRFERFFNRNIHLIVIKDYKKISDEFYVNLINGVGLYGYINKK